MPPNPVTPFCSAFGQSSQWHSITTFCNCSVTQYAIKMAHENIFGCYEVVYSMHHFVLSTELLTEMCWSCITWYSSSALADAIFFIFFLLSSLIFKYRRSSSCIYAQTQELKLLLIFLYMASLLRSVPQLFPFTLRYFPFLSPFEFVDSCIVSRLTFVSLSTDKYIQVFPFTLRLTFISSRTST